MSRYTTVVMSILILWDTYEPGGGFGGLNTSAYSYSNGWKPSRVAVKGSQPSYADAKSPVHTLSALLTRPNHASLPG